ncbi:MAG TPA: helix-turn-helix transcriptional regulator [Acidobacteriota bacterium]|nr:helix-turn-helix transcriptional regulator [Acidobacteriota bacterium]
MIESRPDTIACHRRAVKRVISKMRKHVLEMIEQHEEANLGLQDMAQVAYMSPYHFNRTFRRLTGIPPFRFLSALKLEASKRLLLTTTMSVTDVCFEVGYNSLGTFTRRFTEWVGVSPGKARKMAQPRVVPWLRTMKSKIGPSKNPSARLEGEIEAPEGFGGLIFAGLFEQPIPAGAPVACSILRKAGSFRMHSIPDGEFYLFAAGLEWSPNLNDYFLYEKALRGGGQKVTVSEGSVEGDGVVTLRPPDPLDPPILLGLPMLIPDKSKETSKPKVAARHASSKLAARNGSNGGPVRQDAVSTV